MNKTNPLLLFRIGWMDYYAGRDRDEIQGGGSYVEEHRDGGEMWNFEKQDGHCYGYVMTKNNSGIDLQKISHSQSWQRGEKLSGVDIAFIAQHPTCGQVVVGWYKNATVIHKAYNKDKRPEYGYLCWTGEDHAVLLPTAARVFEVKSGQQGFPGRSNIWYGEEKNNAVVQFKKELREYMRTPTTLRERHHGQKTDADEIRSIEKIAVSEVWQFYKNKGYTIKSVERHNCGWDLVAKKNDEELLLEVKGHKGGRFHFELTPNEYEKMQAHHNQYKVCGVLYALTKKPTLSVFAPENHDGKWRLVKEYGKGVKIIELEERMSARAMPILKVGL
ncbi:MAG: DUF3883 domain-containing protein [Gammaproteobacteria bacterium]|nr:DUF3883 domain-containing protein [Gammaproteobacteria bacterium]MDD9870458.1 DUF3883 domain-containing protein [Gammaproteobacteria bacterium]